MDDGGAKGELRFPAIITEEESESASATMPRSATEMNSGGGGGSGFEWTSRGSRGCGCIQASRSQQVGFAGPGTKLGLRQGCPRGIAK